MKVFITGNMQLGSQIYSQCLRDLLRLGKLLKSRRESLEILVDDSPAGLLARKLVSGTGHSTSEVTSAFGASESNVILLYMEDPELDFHYEDRISERVQEGTDIYRRQPPTTCEPPRLGEPVEPYAQFTRAQQLMEKRIRPVPTKGPQIYREVEIRPNGGRPWFYI